jgi:apolipoprotein N-acyltransferase
VTAAIDEHGKVIGRLPTFTVGSLDVTIQGMAGDTPYITSGNNTVLAASLFLLAFGFAFGPSRVDRRRNNASKDAGKNTDKRADQATPNDANRNAPID